MLYSNFIYTQFEKITGDTFKDLVVLLPEGSQEVQMMDTYSYDPRLFEILSIIDSTFINNPEWAEEYSKSLDDYGPFRFDPKFGLSKQEFEEYLKLDDQYRLISSGSEKLDIIHINSTGLITFKGNEKLELLTKIVIDFYNKKIYYADSELKFSSEKFIPEKQTTLKTDHKGYEWSLLNHPDPTLPYYNEDKDGDVKYHNVRFSIYQLKENGRIYISIFETIVQGEGIHQTSRNELSIML